MASPKSASASRAAEKWARVTPARQADYQAGVQGAANRYQAGVDAAGDTYAMGVQAAITENRYESGVSGKGARYATRASSVGAPRWAAGVGGARADYEQGVAHVFSAVAAVSLPIKGPKGSPQNLQRVQAVVEAERAARR